MWRDHYGKTYVEIERRPISNNEELVVVRCVQSGARWIPNDFAELSDKEARMR